MAARMHHSRPMAGSATDQQPQRRSEIFHVFTPRPRLPRMLPATEGAGPWRAWSPLPGAWFGNSLTAVQSFLGCKAILVSPDPDPPECLLFLSPSHSAGPPLWSEARLPQPLPTPSRFSLADVSPINFSHLSSSHICLAEDPA